MVYTHHGGNIAWPTDALSAGRHNMAVMKASIDMIHIRTRYGATLSESVGRGMAGLVRGGHTVLLLSGFRPCKRERSRVVIGCIGAAVLR